LIAFVPYHSPASFIQTLTGHGDQCPTEPPKIEPGLVAGHKDLGLPSHGECKSRVPDSASGIKPQLGEFIGPFAQASRPARSDPNFIRLRDEVVLFLGCPEL